MVSRVFRGSLLWVKEARTEDKLLGRRKHVERESHFILVLLLLHPFREICRLREEKGESRD